MNIVFPMVGKGTRVSSYGVPKPLIKIKGKTIIEHAVSSLGMPFGNYIFVVRTYESKEHNQELERVLKMLQPDCTIIRVDHVTEGAACSVLLAKEAINTDESLLVTNCDQATPWESYRFIEFVDDGNGSCPDACVTTYPHPNIILGQPSPYSFIELNDKGIALRLEEKLAISNHALNGIHWWNHGSDFVQSAEEMISANDRVNGEFYVSKTFNYLIKKGKKIMSFEMQKDEFFALGNPEEIERYLKHHENL